MEYVITILEFVAAIITGALTAIPLIVKVIQTADELRRSRNWGKLVGIIADLMEDAEALALDGADKKAWVMGGVESLADAVDFDIDMAEVENLIERLCAMSKKVNAGGG